MTLNWERRRLFVVAASIQWRVEKGVPGPAGMDIGTILSAVASGGVGGGALMAIIGFIKQAMAKK